MKIRKYEARTEYEAIEKVKNDLGKDALVLNIKKISPKGIFKLFRRPSVEVMAALDEQFSKTNLQNEKRLPEYKNSDPSKTSDTFNLNLNASKHVIDEQKKTIKSLENKLDNLEGLLTKVMEKVSTESQIQIIDNSNQTRQYNSTILQLFYDSLIKNEVLPEIAEIILSDLDQTEEVQSNNINDLVGIVYNRIMQILGKPSPIELTNNKPKIVFFIGPTGVGKTTTIAKITAHFALNLQKKVGLITADTYRIAAVEQLKTYAEILNVPVEVIYAPEELTETLEKMKSRDIIFIDTAGRSHKNLQQFQELNHLISTIEEKEVFLVLSATTKYKDMVHIINKYSPISNYRIIFTKIDETTALGTILNIRYLTQKPLSYITFGQNVPDDIELMSPEKMTKALLGSMEE
ncbi:flagellar biosynthesis protein FlhF [Defluviitalea saccharophila]|uniref:Flagellar biosynthesis protein FlhF n=1 Tax=Defluviitalea saccharophila TaxID=879970 RepID=A0ABZ2Y4G4_9FIRM|nr:flagellar biosynthesis protein FlhF [Candidatus Epulonipiscium sp.]